MKHLLNITLFFAFAILVTNNTLAQAKKNDDFYDFFRDFQENLSDSADKKVWFTDKYFFEVIDPCEHFDYRAFGYFFIGLEKHYNLVTQLSIENKYSITNYINPKKKKQGQFTWQIEFDEDYTREHYGVRYVFKLYYFGGLDEDQFCYYCVFAKPKDKWKIIDFQEIKNTDEELED